jgi:hypothetical protein
MPDEVPTVAELERLAATPNQYVCASVLARVCRHALALEAEVARLRQLPDLTDALDTLRPSDLHRRVVGYMDYLLAEVARLRRQVEDSEWKTSVPDDQLPRLSDLRGLLKHEVHEDDGDSE